MKIALKNRHKIDAQRKVILKFILLLSVLVLYFFYLSYQYGILTGGFIAALTWSFFVLCTPIADAGFLLDFPIRLIFGIRMLYSETLVWTLAISLNIYALSSSRASYDKTLLTTILKKIILTPYPYWSIIFLSMMGTFLSIYFGDAIMDVFRHWDRFKDNRRAFIFKLIGVVSLFGLIFLAYYFLLDKLNINIDGV